MPYIKAYNRRSKKAVFIKILELASDIDISDMDELFDDLDEIYYLLGETEHILKNLPDGEIKISDVENMSIDDVINLANIGKILYDIKTSNDWYSLSGFISKFYIAGIIKVLYMLGYYKIGVVRDINLKRDVNHLKSYGYDVIILDYT